MGPELPNSPLYWGGYKWQLFWYKDQMSSKPFETLDSDIVHPYSPVYLWGIIFYDCQDCKTASV